MTLTSEALRSLFINGWIHSGWCTWNWAMRFGTTCSMQLSKQSERGYRWALVAAMENEHNLSGTRRSFVALTAYGPKCLLTGLGSWFVWRRARMHIRSSPISFLGMVTLRPA